MIENIKSIILEIVTNVFVYSSYIYQSVYFS